MISYYGVLDVLVNNVGIVCVSIFGVDLCIMYEVFLGINVVGMMFVIEKFLLLFVKL